jgi:hypothetical protein
MERGGAVSCLDAEDAEREQHGTDDNGVAHPSQLHSDDFISAVTSLISSHRRSGASVCVVLWSPQKKRGREEGSERKEGSR